MKKVLFLVFLTTFSSSFAQKVIDVKDNLVVIDADSGFGKIGDIIKILRPIENDTTVIGYVKILKFERNTTIAEIVKEKKDFQIKNGDLIGGKKSDVFAYFSIGVLNGGAFKSNLYLEDIGFNIPYELHYPDNTEIINIGALVPVIKTGSLQGFFNIGIPLRNIRISTTIFSTTVTERLDIVSMFFDAGLMLYPMKFWQSKSRIQPFLQGGIGMYIVADKWETILIGLLISSDDVYTPDVYDILKKRMDIDVQFSYGGGIDYYLSENIGLRLSFKKLKFNLPDMKGSINPLEIHLGIFGNTD